LDTPPKVQIEVTPEMIEAGANVLREHADIGPYQSNHLAAWVFQAMVGADLSCARDHSPAGQRPKTPQKTDLSPGTCKQTPEHSAS
jgi:hypothetical protein